MAQRSPYEGLKMFSKPFERFGEFLSFGGYQIVLERYGAFGKVQKILGLFERFSESYGAFRSVREGL